MNAQSITDNLEFSLWPLHVIPDSAWNLTQNRLPDSQIPPGLLQRLSRQSFAVFWIADGFNRPLRRLLGVVEACGLIGAPFPSSQ